MKKLFTLIYLCSFINVYAQKGNKENTPLNILPSDIKVDKGAIQEPSKRTFFSEIILQDSTGFYGYSTGFMYSEGKIYLSHFSNDMDLVKQQENEFEYNDKDLDLVAFKAAKKVLYVFLTYYNEKDKKTYLFVQSINKQTLLPNNDLKKVAEVEAVGRGNQGDFTVEISKDESKILIYGKEPKRKRDAREEGETFALAVLDNKANILWNKSVTLPYTDKLYENNSVKVDNEGNVYLLGTLYQDKVKEKNREGKPNYDEIITYYTESGAKADEFRIDLKDKFITDLAIMPTNRGEIICSGFYADKASQNAVIKGVFYLKANAFSKKVESESYKEFDSSFLDDITIGFGFLKKKGLFKFRLNDIILRSDGGAVLLAEQFYVMTTTSSSGPNGRSSSSTHYFYNTIIAVNINPSGNIDWVTNIPKYEVSTNDNGRYLSYAHAVANGKIYLAFNDNPKNLAIREKPKTSNGAIVTLVEINADGAWNKYPLYSNKDNKTRTRPKVSEQVGKNQLLLYSEGRKKYNFTRVTFK